MSFNVDQDFDHYRRQRIRQKMVTRELCGDFDNAALRELEQVEAREIRDQQLTREVHEFFSAATKKAATIVERMAHDAEAEADQRISGEVEEFLIDSFARMNSLVLAMLEKKKGRGGEEKVEPNVNNIVGPMLDGFRYEGTADLDDKHIGQDPFAVEPEDVVRDFLDTIDPDQPAEEGSVPGPSTEELLAAAADEAPVVAPEEKKEGTAEGEAPDTSEEKRPVSETKVELEEFKETLRTLVRQGTMTKDEARAAWTTRLRKMGLT